MSLAKSFKLLLAGLVLACGVQASSQAAVRVAPSRFAMPAVGPRAVFNSGPRIAVSPWLNPQPEPPIPLNMRHFVNPLQFRALNPQPEPPIWLMR